MDLIEATSRANVLRRHSRQNVQLPICLPGPQLVQVTGSKPLVPTVASIEGMGGMTKTITDSAGPALRVTRKGPIELFGGWPLGWHSRYGRSKPGR
jgi:hypothetical protein